jgi:hypothetical protein
MHKLKTIRNRLSAGRYKVRIPGKYGLSVEVRLIGAHWYLIPSWQQGEPLDRANTYPGKREAQEAAHMMLFRRLQQNLGLVLAKTIEP